MLSPLASALAATVALQTSIDVSGAGDFQLLETVRQR